MLLSLCNSLNLSSNLIFSSSSLTCQGVAIWYYEPESEHKLRVPGTVLDIIAGEMVTVQNVATLHTHTLPAKELRLRKDFVHEHDHKVFVDMDDMLTIR